MHPDSVCHLGQQYQLTHLNQHIEQCQWLDKEKNPITFSVRVRYSSHCYSEVAAPPDAEGSYIFKDRNQDRIFCPVRHSHSLSLPGLIQALIAKPTSGVSLTTEQRNLSVYWLTMNPPLAPNHKYFAFFRLRRSDPNDGATNPYRLDLFIESAYQRDQPVVVKQRFLFGGLAEKVAKGLM